MAKYVTRREFDALRVADQQARDLALSDRAYKDEQNNRFREQIHEERGRYVEQGIYADRHEELIRRISAIEKALAEGGGRSAGINAVWGIGLALIPSLVLVVLYLSSHG